jgi:hypothetical protein
MHFILLLPHMIQKVVEDLQNLVRLILINVFPKNIFDIIISFSFFAQSALQLLLSLRRVRTLLVLEELVILVPRLPNKKLVGEVRQVPQGVCREIEIYYVRN